MAAFNTAEIWNYHLGKLPGFKKLELESRIANDEDFARTVAIEKAVLDLVKRGTGPIRLKRRMVAIMRLALCMCGLLVVGSAAALAVGKALDNVIFEDSFSAAIFDITKWHRLPPEIVNRGGGVRPETGFMRLVNRGYLQPIMEFPDAIRIEFEWKWHLLGLDPIYADHLTIAVRTHGRPNTAEFFEASDGILIKLSAWSHTVSFSDTMGNTLKTTELSSVKMPHEQWHRVTVVDNGKSISVFVEGPAIQQQPEPTPVLTMDMERTESDGRQIVIYNRELTGFPHESDIRSVVIRELE